MHLATRAPYITAGEGQCAPAAASSLLTWHPSLFLLPSKHEPLDDRQLTGLKHTAENPNVTKKTDCVLDLPPQLSLLPSTVLVLTLLLGFKKMHFKDMCYTRDVESFFETF